jgi:hypothetical protein
VSAADAGLRSAGVAGIVAIATVGTGFVVHSATSWPTRRVARRIADAAQAFSSPAAPLAPQVQRAKARDEPDCVRRADVLQRMLKSFCSGGRAGGRRFPFLDPAGHAVADGGGRRLVGWARGAGLGQGGCTLRSRSQRCGIPRHPSTRRERLERFGIRSGCLISVPLRTLRGALRAPSATSPAALPGSSRLEVIVVAHESIACTTRGQRSVF